MDFDDWLRRADARPMLEFVFPIRSEGSYPDMPRKLRLYLAACGRVQWNRLPGPARVTLALAEHMADGWTPPAGLYATLYDVADAVTRCEFDPEGLAAAAATLAAHGFVADAPAGPAGFRPVGEWERVTALGFVPLWKRPPIWNFVHPSVHRADFVRDIFCHPDRPAPAFSADWRTPTVVTLAASMYTSRDFGGMPVLADALEEAGCASELVLDHCRAAEPHCRGCWVVDAILEKTA